MGMQRLFSRHLLQDKRLISSSQLTVEKTSDKSRFEKRPKKEDLVFGTTMSDHMLTVEWDLKNGWSAPKIIPYQNLSISPAASSLHYGKWIRSMNARLNDVDYYFNINSFSFRRTAML